MRVQDTNLDLIRSIAIFLVVLLHANSGQFLKVGDGWWFSNAVNSATRVCVPLFIIISGALLIPRSEPLSKHLRRFAKLFVLIFVWSYIYAAWIMASGNGYGFLWDKQLTSLLDPTIPSFIASYPMMAHLHFLYSLAVFYLFLPILQAVYASPRGKECLAYFLVVCFLTATISTLNAATGVAWLWLPDIQMFSLFAGYAAFGALVGRYRPSRKVGLVAAAGFGWVTSITMLATREISAASPSEIFATYWSPTVAIAAALALIALRAVHIPDRYGWIATRIGGLSFGIYFIHMIVISQVIAFVWRYSPIERTLNVAATAGITYVISFAAAFLLSSNKISRKLIT